MRKVWRYPFFAKRGISGELEAIAGKMMLAEARPLLAEVVLPKGRAKIVPRGNALMILRNLKKKGMCPGGVRGAARCGLSLGSWKHHIGVLKSAGYVEVRETQESWKGHFKNAVYGITAEGRAFLAECE